MRSFTRFLTLAIMVIALVGAASFCTASKFGSRHLTHFDRVRPHRHVARRSGWTSQYISRVHQRRQLGSNDGASNGATFDDGDIGAGSPSNANMGSNDADGSQGSSTINGPVSAGATNSSRVADIPAEIQGVVTGFGTFYEQMGTWGSCGVKHSDSDFVVAVKTGVMNKKLCGRQVEIEGTKTGKTVRATIADTCGCRSNTSLDLSHAAFDAIGNRDDGVIPIRWAVIA